MIVQPYWITPRIAIIPRPRGRDWLPLEMEVAAAAGVDIIVSLLPQNEAEELGLAGEQAAATEAGIVFFNFPIEDRGVPDNAAEFDALLASVAELVASGKRVGMHCRACIGRSSVLAASLLIRSGMPSATAWKKIEAARQFPVPDTKAQREWVDANIGPNE